MIIYEESLQQSPPFVLDNESLTPPTFAITPVCDRISELNLGSTVLNRIGSVVTLEYGREKCEC